MSTTAYNHDADIVAAFATGGDDTWFRDELADAWRAAQDDALGAYRAWQDSRGSSEYTAYRAAQDRADQAQDVLASDRVANAGPIDARGQSLQIQ